MADVYETRLKENSNEEILPGYSADFPYVNSRAFLDNYHVPWHWHKAVELFYMESGELEYETPGSRTYFPQGSGGLINADVLHITRPCADAPTIQRLHIFDASFIGGQPDGRIAQKYIAPIINAPGLEVIPLMPDNPAHAEVLNKIRESFKIDTSDFRYELKLRETLEDIWVDLLGLMPEERSDTYASSIKIKQMMVFVQEHYSERIKISDIADAAYVSERDCYRVFQTFLHTTPADYLKSCRIQAACRMLAGGDDSITRISFACGFSSSSFFGKVFLAETGMTPSEYRRMWQNITR